MQNIRIRPIIHSDNAILASIIRNTLAEFKANKPGTVFFDSATDNLFSVFQQPQSAYFVAEYNNAIVGGAGIFPSEGLPKDTCELVKMYLLPEARSKGIGKLLMDTCLDFASENNFTACYIETMPELHQAIALYQKYGFIFLDKPMGNTGHTGCDIWMIKKM